MPGSVGSIGSLIPRQPLVGSEVCETARYPTSALPALARAPNHRPESGSYSRRGSLTPGRSNPGFTFFQNSVWDIASTTLPVFFSWMTTLALVKSMTWSGPTAPVLSGQSLGPGPEAPGNVVTTVTSAGNADTNRARRAIVMKPAFTVISSSRSGRFWTGLVGAQLGAVKLA